MVTCAYPKKRDAFFTNVVNRFDLSKIYRENINNLSGGQIQRVFIARALLSSPKLLILDEPTVGVDAENVIALHDTLKELKEDGITIILISHDPHFCNDLYDYSLILNDLGDYTFSPNRKEEM